MNIYEIHDDIHYANIDAITLLAITDDTVITMIDTLIFIDIVLIIITPTLLLRCH